MARAIRVQFSGACYHVINRGYYQRNLFDDGGAADAFVRTLGEAATRFGWRIHAYVVMRNHFHLALQINEPAQPKRHSQRGHAPTPNISPRKYDFIDITHSPRSRFLMARAIRVQFPGACYHVINRGNYQRNLFEDGGAADAFVRTPGEAATRFGWRIHAYVVMRNHFHLALQINEPNLSDGRSRRGHVPTPNISPR